MQFGQAVRGAKTFLRLAYVPYQSYTSFFIFRSFEGTIEGTVLSCSFCFFHVFIVNYKENKKIGRSRANPKERPHPKEKASFVTLGTPPGDAT